ncbi:uncharacterized protein LOC144624780 [Crassostrea virginica]
MRVVRQRREQESQEEEEVDLEAVSCLLNFSTRERGQPRPQTPGAQVTVSSFVIEGTPGAAEGVTTSTSVMVRTFATSPPTTPASAPRPDRPPPIISGRRQSGHLVRPRPLRRSLEEQERDLRRMTHSYHSCTGSAPSAALGAPPRQEEEEEDNESLELPDLPETPASPATSDITVISSASSPIIIPLDSDEEYYSELEYVDPYEGEGPHSNTPPPSCDGTKNHEICVPPPIQLGLPPVPGRGPVRRRPPGWQPTTSGCGAPPRSPFYGVAAEERERKSNRRRRRKRRSQRKRKKIYQSPESSTMRHWSGTRHYY